MGSDCVYRCRARFWGVCSYPTASRRARLDFPDLRDLYPRFSLAWRLAYTTCRFSRNEVSRGRVLAQFYHVPRLGRVATSRKEDIYGEKGLAKVVYEIVLDTYL